MYTSKLRRKREKNVWKTGQNIIINQDAVVLFRLSNLGAFVFEFTLDAVIIKSAVVFAPIQYAKKKKMHRDKDKKKKGRNKSFLKRFSIQKMGVFSKDA